jgi:hypothetical protein
MEIAELKKELLENEELIAYLVDKNTQTEWYYEKFLYFVKCVGDNCKYAEACIKLMKEDIDEFYTGRSANNPS